MLIDIIRLISQSSLLIRLLVYVLLFLIWSLGMGLTFFGRRGTKGSTPPPGNSRIRDEMYSILQSSRIVRMVVAVSSFLLSIAIVLVIEDGVPIWYHGQVIDIVTKRAIQSAQISIDGSSIDNSTQFSDATGYFVFRAARRDKTVLFSVIAESYRRVSVNSDTLSEVIPIRIGLSRDDNMDCSKKNNPGPNGDPVSKDTINSSEGWIVVTGTVVDRRSLLPVVGAEVQMIGSFLQTTYTTSSGAFALDVPRGTQRIQIRVYSTRHTPFFQWFELLSNRSIDIRL